jgi:hypothetical protein
MIELGVDFDKAELESRPKPLSEGTYEFRVAKIEEVTSGAGRPGWNWHLEVINRPDVVNRRLFYRTFFPWTPPGSQEVDAGGMGMLVSIMNGIGAKWSGTQLPEPAVFFGKVGVMRVGIRERKVDVNDPESETVQENTVRIMTKRTGGGVVS